MTINSHFTRLFYLPLLLILLALLASTSAVAADNQPSPSALTLVDGSSPTIRDPVEITVQLTDPVGNAVGAADNEALELYIDRQRVRRTRTDSQGFATFTVRNELPAGVYTAHVLYNGSKSLAPAVLSTEIVIEPAELEIQSVPPLEGITFTLNGEQFLSDKAGVARAEVDRLGIYQLKVIPRDSSSRQLRFNRWRDEVFTPEREIDIKRVQTLEVGFDTSYDVTTAFYDLDGLPVDPVRIERVVLRSSHGTESILLAPDIGTDQTGAIWLQAGRVVRRFHGLEETPILWSVESVEIEGTNVVNRAQQRFFVHEEDLWNIQLLLYEARFTARDALFGYPLGSGINLEYPNGSVDVIHFSNAAEVTVPSLPRGEYRVNVAGAPGLSPFSPVALSRDQEVHLLVISYLDIGVAVALLSILALGLLLVGRPSLLRYLRLPDRGRRLQHILLGMCALALVVGISILSFGSRTESAQSSALRTESNPPVTEASLRSPEDFTTGDPDESLVTSKSQPETILDDVYLDTMHQRQDPRIAKVFESFWATNGGFAVFGKPVSRPNKKSYTDTDAVLVMQHFEHATLEYRAQSDGCDASIHLRNLGALLADENQLRATPHFLAVGDQTQSENECRYFRQTNHFVCDEFLSYWSSIGLEYGRHTGPFRKSVQLLGYPISEAFEDPETGRTIQYFQRSVLEAFPEFAETPHFVQRSSLKGAQS